LVDRISLLLLGWNVYLLDTSNIVWLRSWWGDDWYCRKQAKGNNNYHHSNREIVWIIFWPISSANQEDVEEARQNKGVYCLTNCSENVVEKLSLRKPYSTYYQHNQQKGGKKEILFVDLFPQSILVTIVTWLLVRFLIKLFSENVDDVNEIISTAEKIKNNGDKRRYEKTYMHRKVYNFLMSHLIFCRIVDSHQKILLIRSI